MTRKTWLQLSVILTTPLLGENDDYSLKKVYEFSMLGLCRQKGLSVYMNQNRFYP